MRNMLPWLIIGLSLVGGLGVYIWNSLRPEEDEEIGEGPDAKRSLAITAAEGNRDLATTTEEGLGRASRLLSVRASFEKSLETLGPRAQTRDRRAMPWFMLVGADGSGKNTVLANSGLALPAGPPMEVDPLRKDAGKWWQFEDAVVLEAPAAAPGTTAGTATLPPGQTVADSSIGWHTLLHMLRRERPDSPLNGMIVTISCGDLLSARANPERLADQAARIRNFLDRTRKTLGVRLPLHVLVTKCDALPGFRTFARTLPEKRRDDIFGWANPNDIDTPFDPVLVERGFLSLRRKLADLRDELMAAPDEVSDTVGLFVFDTEFADMQEPLKDFISQLIFDRERRPTLYFRGMYFTGDALEPVPSDQALTINNGQALRPNTTGAREICGAPYTAGQPTATSFAPGWPRTHWR
jgi:type VI secretion system protein ImpL